MSARAAALRLEVTGGPGTRHLAVFAGESTTPAWSGDLSEGELGSVHRRLRQALTDIHDLVGNRLEPGAAPSRDAVQTLLTLAPRVAYGLFRGPGLKAVLDAARVYARFALDPGVPPRVVEVTTPGDFNYPFELIAWHRAGDRQPDPTLRARSLLGMSAIVRRRIHRVGSEGADRLDHAARLPITVLQHPDLDYPDGETRYLQRLDGLVDLHGPWPARGRFVDEPAIQHLLDSRTSLDGSPRRSRPARVVHVSCHCDTTSDDSDEHEIALDAEPGSIRLGQLKIFASEPEAWDAELPRPLVFLNACGTAVPHPSSRVSFPEFFLDQKSLGVVGTLCDISDETAAHFAAVFYERLLRGRSVGEAMYDARWHLMDRHGNPLGLLYTYFGNPDLTLSRPRSGELVPACTQPDRRA